MNIEINNLFFAYNSSTEVIKDVSLKFKDNETIAIVGASGSGKSTLLRLLSGLIKSTKDNIYKGDISIDGQDVETFAKKGFISFMFQEPTLFPNLTVRRNVIRPLEINGIKDYSKADELIKMVGLEKFKDFLPNALSGGMKTRVALARTFVTEPKLLLLDEPFSSLDVRWRFLLYQELEKLRQAYNPTTIVVTHDIQEALFLSNNIVVFGKNGRILKQLKINKPLPRSSNFEILKELQNEYYEIQSLIMTDNPVTI